MRSIEKWCGKKWFDCQNNTNSAHDKCWSINYYNIYQYVTWTRFYDELYHEKLLYLFFESYIWRVLLDIVRKTETFCTYIRTWCAIFFNNGNQNNLTFAVQRTWAIVSIRMTDTHFSNSVPGVTCEQIINDKYYNNTDVVHVRVVFYNLFFFIFRYQSSETLPTIMNVFSLF